jgi:hypothetical protein
MQTKISFMSKRNVDYLLFLQLHTFFYFINTSIIVIFFFGIVSKGKKNCLLPTNYRLAAIFCTSLLQSLDLLDVNKRKIMK